MSKRSVLRVEAKKLYKEQTKGIPKRQRISFADFFKQYKGLKTKNDDSNEINTMNEDFDFTDLINVNEIDSDSDDSQDEEENV